jgi:uncharacterized DUF497 family protein
LRWTWDTEKDRINRQKHRITFQTATLVFRDPGVLLDQDPYPLEQRWRAIGYIEGMLVAVTYTQPEGPGVPGRIISARRASREERTDYEEGI